MFLCTKKQKAEMKEALELILKGNYKNMRVVGRGLVVKDLKYSDLSEKEKKENEMLRKLVEESNINS